MKTRARKPPVLTARQVHSRIQMRQTVTHRDTGVAWCVYQLHWRDEIAELSRPGARRLVPFKLIGSDYELSSNATEGEGSGVGP